MGSGFQTSLRSLGACSAEPSLEPSCQLTLGYCWCPLHLASCWQGTWDSRGVGSPAHLGRAMAGQWSRRLGLTPPRKGTGCSVELGGVFVPPPPACAWPVSPGHAEGGGATGTPTAELPELVWGALGAPERGPHLCTVQLLRQAGILSRVPQGAWAAESWPASPSLSESSLMLGP